MFTGVTDEEGAETVKQLGGLMVDSVFQCTHLVTDKVRRTVKFLCCLSRGCTIVSTNWLDKCREDGCFVSTDSFIVKDRTAERIYGFSLKDSIVKARSSPLLKGWSVFMSDNIKPPPNEMKEIVQSAGGQVCVYDFVKFLFRVSIYPSSYQSVIFFHSSIHGWI